MGLRWTYAGNNHGGLCVCVCCVLYTCVYVFVNPFVYSFLLQVNAIFLAIALIKVFKSTHGSVKRQRPMKGIDNKQPTGMDMKEGRTLFV